MLHVWNIYLHLVNVDELFHTFGANGIRCGIRTSSMILPTYPGQIPQTSPFTPTKKEIPKHKLLVKFPGAHLPGGPVGEILGITIRWKPLPPWHPS